MSWVDNADLRSRRDECKNPVAWVLASEELLAIDFSEVAQGIHDIALSLGCPLKLLLVAERKMHLDYKTAFFCGVGTQRENIHQQSHTTEDKMRSLG